MLHEQYCSAHNPAAQAAKSARYAFRRGELQPAILQISLHAEGWPDGERIAIRRALSQVRARYPELRIFWTDKPGSDRQSI